MNKKLNSFNYTFNIIDELKTTKAFTLVELLVVIVILSILGTLGFIYFNGQLEGTKNTVRVTDLGNISKSLEVFSAKNGYYPDPDNGIQITYSGSEVWTQGKFGKNSFTKIKTNKELIDPLINDYYTYSLTKTKNEYQLGTILEGGEILSSNMEIIKKSYAGNGTVAALVKGNYNGWVVSTRKNGITYILASPSIISNDKSETNLVNLIRDNKLVINGYGNLPSSYSDSNYEVDGSENLNFVKLDKILVFSGDLWNLKRNGVKQVELVKKIQDAYSGTEIKDIKKIKTILKINTVSDSKKTKKMAKRIIKTTLKTKIRYNVNDRFNKELSCAYLNYAHAVFVEGIATEINQPWQKVNSNAPCYYECTDNYIGDDCSTLGPCTFPLILGNCVL